MTRIAVLLSALALLAGGCTRKAVYHTATGAAWGTAYHITYKSDRDLSDSIVAEMRQVELSLSMFDPGSRISRINSGATDILDKRLIDVMRISIDVNKASDGMFDPTIAPLTDLWGFGRQGRETPMPCPAAIDSAMARVGMDKCHIAGNRIVKGHPDMEFDLSAVAKGYGVDCVANMLRRNGVSDYMVEIGGEVAVGGVNAKGCYWRIQVDSPSSAPDTHEAFEILELSDCAVASSGNYRSFRDDDGVRTGHTIDPSTGYPAVTRSLATTVVAPSCGLADALATALMICEPDSAASIINFFPSTAAIIITCDSIYRINM